MKSLLYDELRELARKILEAPQGEMSSLQNDARVLYERLTVLRYTEGLVEELKHSMEGTVASAEEGPQEQEANESFADRIDDSPAEAMLPIEQTEEENIQESDENVGNEGEDGLLFREAEAPEEECVQECPDIYEKAVEENIEPVSQQEEPKKEEYPHRRTASPHEDLQQSLFRDELFTKELNFDPDEDLFEECPSEESENALMQNIDGDLQAEDFSPSAAEVYSGDNTGEEIPENDPFSTVSTSFFSFEVIKDEVNTVKDALYEGAVAENDGEPIEDVGFEEGSTVKDQDIPAEPFSEPEVEEPMVAESTVLEERPVFTEDSEVSAEDFSDTISDINEDQQDEYVILDDVPKPSAVVAEEPMSIESEVSTESPVFTTDGEVAAEPLSNPSDEEAEQEGPDAEPDDSPFREKTINDVAAEREKEDRRPSLNEILAASNIKIELNDRIAFIDHLFDGDAEAFESAVRYIFSLTDIDVANEYIIEILKPSYNNWFEQEKYESRFAEIVVRHFINKMK